MVHSHSSSGEPRAITNHLSPLAQRSATSTSTAIRPSARAVIVHRLLFPYVAPRRRQRRQAHDQKTREGCPMGSGTCPASFPSELLSELRRSTPPYGIARDADHRYKCRTRPPRAWAGAMTTSHLIGVQICHPTPVLRGCRRSHQPPLMK